MLRHIPNVAVFAGLAGLAWLGHGAGWRVPRLAAEPPEKDDWCSTHGVPASRCVACRPELGGKDAKDWCREHGVPESACTACHPELLTKGEADDWCREHGVPESGCTLCNPDLAVKGKGPADGRPVKAVPAPGAAPDPSACRTHLVRIQLASPAVLEKAGVKLAAVQEGPLTASASAHAEVGFDTTRVARLSARAAGTVARVEKDVGARVARGEVVALVDAAEVGKAKSELLQSLAAVDYRGKVLDRVRPSAASGVRTRAELDEAEAALREARVRLAAAHQALASLGLAPDLERLAALPEEKLAESVRWLGIPEAIARTLDRAAATANLLPVVSPLDGEVVAREVVAGEAVDASKPLLVVADLSRLWIEADARQEDAGAIAVGQTLFFRADGPLEPAVSGKVVWVGPAVDERTRTVRVRAEVANSERRLRAHVFGTARIVVREEARAVLCPNEAIHFEGCCHVVFVRVADDLFQTRKVRAGVRVSGFTEIVVGLVPGEVIATAGSHVLAAELLKGRLGAGCCE